MNEAGVGNSPIQLLEPTATSWPFWASAILLQGQILETHAQTQTCPGQEGVKEGQAEWL